MVSNQLICFALFCFLVLLRLQTCESQSFGGITELQGYLSAWSPTSTASYGCPAAYELSAPGTSSVLTSLPCNTNSPVNLTGYSPVLNLIQSSADHAVYYSVLVSQPSQTFVLATFNSQTGAAVQVLGITVSILPIVMHVDPITGHIYLVAWQPSALTGLFVYVIDPTQSQWQRAQVTGPVAVVPDHSILPAGAALRVRDELTGSAYVSSASRLLLVLGSTSSTGFSPIWHLLSISPLTGSWYEVVLADPTILASGSLRMTWLPPTSTVLLSSESGAWLLSLTSASGISSSSTAPVTAVSEHVTRAQQALGCGEVGVAVSVAPTVIPSSNSSSLPYVVLLLYAVPTYLSAVQAPFWYMLFVDSTLGQVTYSSIDAPPFFAGQLKPMSSVVTVTSSSGHPLAYSPQHGAALVWQGSFLESLPYLCATDSSTAPAIFVDNSTLTCSLPPGLNSSFVTRGATSWLPFQLLTDEVFVLYSSKLIVTTPYMVNSSISSSLLPFSHIGRLMTSYAVASSLTPTPVTSSTSSSAYAAFSTAGGQAVQGTPLQLHSQLTAGLTFVTQQLLSASTANSQLQTSQVLSSVQSILSAAPVASSGINDAFALLATASSMGSPDFQSIMASASSSVFQDMSGLPQTLTELSTGASTSLALDIIGSQAQSWLLDNVELPLSSDLSSLLGLGATLPDVSSNVLSSLTSLTVNAALQLAEANPVIKGVLNDPIVSALLNLPDSISDVVSDPTQLVGDLLPAGAIKDTVLTLLSGSGDELSDFAGSLEDQFSNVIDNLGDSVSDAVDTVVALGESLVDDIATDAVDLASGEIGGVLGSVSGLIATAFGASAQVQKIVSGAVSAVSGIGEIVCGDVEGGVEDCIKGVISLVSGLFGGGSSGPDETQQLSQQMSKSFSQVFQDLSAISSQINNDTNLILQDLGTLQTNLLMADQQLSKQINDGFTELANLSIAEFTQLQNQQYSLYTSEMSSLANIAQGVSTLEISATAAQALLLQLITITEGAAYGALKTERDILSGTTGLEGYFTQVNTALGAVPSTNGTFSSRSVPGLYIEQYQTYMNVICVWATSQNDAAAAAMSGGPTDPSQTITSASQISPFYDLLFAWIPLIVSHTLSQPLPALLQPALFSNLPNPLAYARATNFWLEARQAALQTSLAGNANCLSSLWHTGQQMQAAVRLAVAPSTLNAAYAQLSTIANDVLLDVTAVFTQGAAGDLANLQHKVNALNNAGTSFAAFDEICAVATLLLTIGQAAGMGSNGFTNGFVSNGVASDPTQQVSNNYQPGQYATRLIPFATVTSTSSLASALFGSLSSTPNATVNGSLVPSIVISQAQTLLLLTVLSMRNAIDAFYSPCAPLPLTVRQSLPSIDVTLRRLAGFMMQTQTPFTYQGKAINFPAPSLIRVAPSISSSTGSSLPSSPRSSSASTSAPSNSASLCLILYGLPGNVDYPFSVATVVQFSYSPTVIRSSAGTGVTILAGSGTRTFTNRFGASVATSLTIAPSGTNSSDNILYLGSSSPFDQNGLTWILSSPVQQPGHGPSALYTQLNVYNASSGVIVEDGASRFDAVGQAFLSTVPGFNNISIPASNVNSLAVNYATCQAPISFTNGLRAPTQPSAGNGGMKLSFSYYISDGATYAVTCNLTVTTSSAFATQKDQLGNPFQTVLNVTGTRTYASLGTGISLTSTVTGLTRSGRFYPYSLLAAAPGVYSVNSAPLLDYDGLAFNVAPSVPGNGATPGSGPQYTVVEVSMYSSAPLSAVLLTESHYTQLPNAMLQQQQYAIL